MTDADNKRWITSQGNVRVFSEMNVLEAALERTRYCFDNSERVVVSFSCGKDSTTILQLALQVAKEKDRLPLEVWYFDDEILDPDSIEYGLSVAARPDIDFKWYCLPIKHTLRSQHRTSWHTWDPDEQDVWVRDMPDIAISEIEGWDVKNRKISGLPQICFHLARQIGLRDQLVMLAGIRGAESFNRVRAVMQGGSYLVDREQYIYAKPIYDWTTPDVWKYLRDNKFPYSAFYDKQRAAGLTDIQRQRVAPWGNVAGARTVSFFAKVYPDFWEKALRRLPELRAQQRYGDTKLFRQVMNKPLHLTWQEYTLHLVSQMDDEDRAFWSNQIIGYLRRWRLNNSVPFPQEPIEGSGLIHWKRLAHAVQKNDRMDGSSRDLM